MSLVPSPSPALMEHAWPRFSRVFRGLAFPLTAILVTTLICSLFGLLVARGAALLLVSSEEPSGPSGRDAPVALADLDEEGDEEAGESAVASRNLLCHRCGADGAPREPARVGSVPGDGTEAPEASLVATVSSPSAPQAGRS